jgi:hypothetical protein
MMKVDAAALAPLVSAPSPAGGASLHAAVLVAFFVRYVPPQRPLERERSEKTLVPGGAGVPQR